MIPITHWSEGVFDLLGVPCSTTTTNTVVGSGTEGGVEETGGGEGEGEDGVLGNGKAPFGVEVDEEEEVGVVGASGLVDMVTYNSLTVDPINGEHKTRITIPSLFS